MLSLSALKCTFSLLVIGFQVVGRVSWSCSECISLIFSTAISSPLSRVADLKLQQMLCGQCLFCFYALSLPEVTALVLLLFCFMQLGLNTVEQELWNWVQARFVQQRFIFYLWSHEGAVFYCSTPGHRVSHLVFSFCWCFGVLDHWGPLPWLCPHHFMQILHFSVCFCFLLFWNLN